MGWEFYTLQRIESCSVAGHGLAVSQNRGSSSCAAAAAAATAAAGPREATVAAEQQHYSSIVVVVVVFSAAVTGHWQGNCSAQAQANFHPVLRAVAS